MADNDNKTPEDAARMPDDGAPEAAEAGAETAEDAGLDRTAELEAQVGELKDQLLRALAETENLRRRSQREREDAIRYAAAPLVRDIIDVADNLKRALEAVPAEAVEADEHLKNLMTGVGMTEKALQAAFEKHHIRRLDPIGERLDPHAHEAIFEVPDPSQPAGTIVQVVRAGYRLHDRLLRAAQVGVAKGGPAPDPKGKDVKSGDAKVGDAKDAGESNPDAGNGERRDPGSRVDTTA